MYSKGELKEIKDNVYFFGCFFLIVNYFQSYRKTYGTFSPIGSVVKLLLWKQYLFLINKS